jgi:hypothetical protein
MNRLHNLMAGILMLLALVTVSVPAQAATDSTQPVTSAILAGTKGGDGWYSTAVTVILAATDGTGGSGVAKTEYSLDNVTWQPYSSAFVLDQDGDQYVYFRSTDYAGNIETTKSQEVKINKTGLVGLWHMDGDWMDASVVANQGTPYSGATFGTNAKVGTKSGSFDGVSSYVSVADNPTLHGNLNQTVMGWVYVNGFNKSHQTIFYKGNAPECANYCDNREYALFLHSSGHLEFRSTPVDRVGVGEMGVNTPDGVIQTGDKGGWYHIAAVISSTQNSMKIYVNGEEKGSAPYSKAGIRTTSGALQLGNNPFWNGSFYGYVDDFSIYNRDLSAAEIQAQYRTYVVKSPMVNPVPSSTAAPTITLSGTKPANTSIVINGKIMVPLDGMTSWQANYALLPGANSLTVAARDNQNFDSLPVNLSVVLDATPPQVTATTPQISVVLKSAPAAVTFTLSDAISPIDYAATLKGATVTTAAGITVSGTWSSSASGTSGSVTFKPATVLGNGYYSATIKPTDSLGNCSTYTVTFAVDTVPPVPPVIVPVTVPLNTTSTTITGTKSSDSAIVAISCDGATFGTVAYPTATTWSVNVSGLKEGGNIVTAYAVDAAGNQSGIAATTVTVDITPPAVGTAPAGGIYKSAQSVTISSNELAAIYYTTDGSTPTLGAAQYSQPLAITAGTTLKYFARDLAGNSSEIKTENYVIDTTPPVLAVSTLSEGSYTNNEILNIAGTVTDNTEVKGLTVNDTAVSVNADGSFSYPLLLKNGVNILSVTATDTVGNMASDTRKVTLDQTAPVLAVTAPADNIKTGKVLLDVNGTVDETSTVTVKVKDTVQSALMNGGAFTATINLDPGFNTIEIIATDLAGNRSSVKRTVIFDDQAPSLAAIAPNQDIRTNQSSLTIKGTVYDALTAVGVTITKDNETFTPKVIDGTFAQDVNFSEEKTYAIIVTATNEAGTSASIQRNVIYDITPPVLSIDPLTSPTSQPNLTITGTREAGATVSVTCPTATVGTVSYPAPTVWRADISGLSEGKNVITAVSADVAGNAVTTTATVVLATKPPEITIKTSTDVIWPANNKMVPVTITGGVESYGSSIKTVAISVSDEYGKYKYSNLKFGSTVMLEASRKGNDKDGRKYTITVVVTGQSGVKTSKTATVVVPHDATYLKKSHARGSFR